MAVRTMDTIWEDTVDPTVNDDSTIGIQGGDQWRNTSTGAIFQCDDNSAGAAVWGKPLSDKDIGTLIAEPPLYGEVHMQGNLTNTVIAAANTPVKVAGTTTNGNSSSDITLGTNSITYTGTDTKTFVIEGVGNLLRIGGGGLDGTVYIARNGAVVVKSGIQAQLNAQERPFAVQCILDLAQNDFVEVWAENNTNGQDLRVEHMNLKVHSL